MSSDSSEIPSIKNIEVVAGKVNPPKDVSKSTVDPNDSNSSDIPSVESFEYVCGKIDPLSDVSQSTFDPNDSNSSDICSPKKFGDFDGKVNPHSDVSKSKCHSDSDSVEIIDFSVHFSPYKSQLERVISEELSLIAKEEEKLSKKEKRKLSLLCWKWEEVVDLCEDEELGVDLPFIPKFGDFDGKVNPHSDVSKSKCHSDSDSVEIIDFSVHFSPYKSQLERVISEELSLIAKEEEKLSKKEKRKLSLLCWKWEEVVDLCEDEELGVDLPFIPDDLRNVKDEGFSASISELNHTECKDDDVGLFPIQTNVVESVSPKSATSTIKVVCDNHQVDVSDKLIYKDASGNMKDDAIVAPMYEVASNSNENDGVTKSVSNEKDVEDNDRCDNVGDDTIEDDISKTPISICGLQDGGESEVGDDTIKDDMSKTPISICGLQDGGESEDVCAVIEVDSSEKSFIGSSITPMKRRLPRLCDESFEDDIVG
ncbi:unnamed protein product [Lactuca virosa]|uniref:Uncharacterized protein n=1 Tax=Lactuca virosa TaxID=75947 RepID=A0AAU9P471_9ASTR|nr:unnamed protein product [Lactuca virosa]